MNNEGYTKWEQHPIPGYLSKNQTMAVISVSLIMKTKPPCFFNNPWLWPCLFNLPSTSISPRDGTGCHTLSFTQWSTADLEQDVGSTILSCFLEEPTDWVQQEWGCKFHTPQHILWKRWYTNGWKRRYPQCYKMVAIQVGSSLRQPWDPWKKRSSFITVLVCSFVTIFPIVYFCFSFLWKYWAYIPE